MYFRAWPFLSGYKTTIVVLYPLRKAQARKYILDYLYLFQLA